MVRVLKRTISMRQSFEQLRHMLKLIDNKIITIIPQKLRLSRPMEFQV